MTVTACPASVLVRVASCVRCSGVRQLRRGRFDIVNVFLESVGNLGRVLLAFACRGSSLVSSCATVAGMTRRLVTGGLVVDARLRRSLRRPLVVVGRVA